MITMRGVLTLAMVLLGTPGAAERCRAHRSRMECLVFRRQDDCAWDVASSACVADRPCERRSPERCEYELTSGAPWDATRNRCFYDASHGRCRPTGVCMAPDTAGACEAAGCSWETRCARADVRYPPGPGACKQACVPPPATGSISAGAFFEAAPEAKQCAKLKKACRKESPYKPCCAGLMCKSFATAGDICVEDTAESAEGAPTTRTTGGAVSGTTYGTVDFYGGVPYAASPVSELRWAPPSTVAWNGTLAAQDYGPACVQSLDDLLFAHGGGGRTARRGARGAGASEDCLNANVWTPNTGDRKAAIMVWIHGGCYVSGSNAAAAYDGYALASERGVVVISINYRLGALGFLAHNSLRERDGDRGSTGNYGLLDAMFALEWVKANAEAFGGDGDRVTIFGQSAGAGSVSALTAIPAAWPFFDRAILESGSGDFWTYQSMAAGETNWKTLTRGVACAAAPDVVACLLEAAPADLADAVAVVPCRDGCTWAPTIDGALLEGRIVDRARQGLLKPNLATISGFNLNDGAAFVPGFGSGALYSMDAAGLESFYADGFGEEHVKTLASTFPVPGGFPGADGYGYSSDFYAAQQCETDYSYACAAFWYSEAFAQSYVYHFVEPTQGGLAYHGDEISYVFGTLANPSPAMAEASADVMGYWTAFAKTGDPNGGNRTAWPSWSKTRRVLNISSAPEAFSVPEDAYLGCGFFATHSDYFDGCLPVHDDDGA